MSETDKGMRLNKYLARAGQGSRRAVEEIIRAGRVAIDGQTVNDLGRRVNPDQDKVTVDERPVFLPDDFRVYAFNKPLGIVSTLKSQGGQGSLLPFRLRADIPERFVPIGRLDAETTGLLLWTDDGELNQNICRPHTGVWKKYLVELNEPPSQNVVKKLIKGDVELDGRPCRPCRLTLDQDKTTRHWVMELQEGRKRQIRRMFQAVNIKVLKLHRVSVGDLELGLLRPGDFRRLTRDEEQGLRRAVAGK